MRLHGVSNGRIVASEGTVIYRGTGDGSFERDGCIRLPAGVGDWATRLTMGRRWKSLAEAFVGRFSTVNVWPVSDAYVATVGRYLLRSADGTNWSLSRQLPASSGQMGVLPSSLAVHGEMLYLGEYPLARDATPRLLRSPDGGRTWNPVRSFPDVRHLHGVQVDPFDDGLWVTTGDRDAACRIYRYFPADDDLFQVGGGSQHWRAVELALTPKAVLWGMDCAYADRNLVYKLPRNRIELDSPEPDVIHELDNSVYYAATLQADGDHWAVFATSAEAGGDSTAPGSENRETRADRAVVTASSATSGYTEWHRLASYRRRRSPTDAWNPGGRLPIANAYVFLQTMPETGLLVNPYNTRRHDGEIRTIPISRFQRMGCDRMSTVTSR